MPESEFGNGMFWAMCFGIDFKVQNGEVILDKFTLDDYDENLSGNVSFADRASAAKFKNLLKSIFSNPELNYPSGYRVSLSKVRTSYFNSTRILI